MPLGLGHAVLCAKPAVGDEPFFVHLADDLIYSDVPCLKQMAQHFEKHGASVLGVETVPRDQTGKLRHRAPCRRSKSGAQRVTRIVEKPKPADAPSNLAVVGRYILTPAIFAKLERTQRGAGGEIQLTDGIASLLADEPCTSCRSPAFVTTAAARSATCARRSSTGCAIPSSAKASARTSQSVWER